MIMIKNHARNIVRENTKDIADKINSVTVMLIESIQTQRHWLMFLIPLWPPFWPYVYRKLLPTMIDEMASSDDT